MYSLQCVYTHFMRGDFISEHVVYRMGLGPEDVSLIIREVILEGVTYRLF